MKIINTKTNVAVCVYLSKKKNNKTDGLYITYHELLLEKWIVERSQFQYPNQQQYSIFATSQLVGCIEYQYNSLEDKDDKSAIARFYQVGWTDYALQDILGQKF